MNKQIYGNTYNVRGWIKEYAASEADSNERDRLMNMVIDHIDKLVDEGNNGWDRYNDLQAAMRAITRNG